MSDNINPGHYQGFSNGAQVIDITENLTFNTGSALKYLARAGRTDGQNKGQQVEDLRKALWYIEREIERHDGALDTPSVTSAHKHPEVLVSETDYRAAPIGTLVSVDTITIEKIGVDDWRYGMAPTVVASVFLGSTESTVVRWGRGE